ncbi:ABC transporter ATP-binding protein [Cryobacterium algoricola]|uniref:ABC transporter ATP-binding protein n=2 Tax=Cryobacterium TaxID=69578 RepID=A0AA41QTI8_9MICO|nr:MULTISPECIES: ABC transporter ATP-binding protein [Cryobacterium]MCI4656913.1 ABC transporter ATP-binding protein [Cryobacterium zhongshanensis]TFB84270.1 ABC transporter ATP-binding protein [Cryobacterium algoricola]
MSLAIRTSGLTKTYGEHRALDSVDLEVEEGSIFGFLGPNGAGKTTLLRMLTGLARPTSGVVQILGHDVTAVDDSIRARIGFLPDVPGFYDWMTAEEFLRFVGRLFSIDRRTLDDRVGMLLGLAGLTDVTTAIGGYSRGMKQRLGVAQALINAPELLLLDEPTSALDPMGRRDVLDMLTSLRGRTTVFFSTHILADVERVCDTVAILDRGRVVAHGPIQELTSRYAERKVILEVTDAAGDLAQDISREPWAASVAVGPTGALEITVTDMDAARLAIPVLVAGRHTGLCRMDAGELGLEDVFVSLVGGGAR